MALLLTACHQAPPSWQQLLATKITQHDARLRPEPTPDGGLLVQRPGQAPVTVDVNAIAQFCQRGPKDCDYATDQMLLSLGKP